MPLSAATCAGWTALSNIYSTDGAFERDVALQRCPDLLVFDHSLVRQAPARTLASGIADALAKWYEASVSSGASNDGIIQQAVQMARVLRDQLLLDAKEALENPKSEAWVRVAEACGLTLVGDRARSDAVPHGTPHAVQFRLTQLSSATGCRCMVKKSASNALVQLRLEERLGGSQLAAQARRQLFPILHDMGVLVTLENPHLGQAGLHELQQQHLPFVATHRTPITFPSLSVKRSSLKRSSAPRAKWQHQHRRPTGAAVEQPAAARARGLHTDRSSGL